MWAALTDGSPPGPEAELWSLGQAQWWPTTTTVEAPGDVEHEDSGPIQFRKSKQRKRGLDRVAPSTLEGGNKVRIRERLAKNNQGALLRGTLVHALFETVTWLDDDVPSDRQLQQCVESLMTRLGLVEPHTGEQADRSNAIAEFREACQLSGMRQLLNRSAYLQSPPKSLSSQFSNKEFSGLKTRVSNEHRFAVRDGDRLSTGSIDRLVLLSRGNLLVAAEVIDFKTDRIENDEQLKARVAHYRPQLEAYRRAVSAMTGLAPEVIAARLAFMDGDRIVEP